ncbi:hypothetical protein FKM82_010087 [Ascaphus truei]
MDPSKSKREEISSSMARRLSNPKIYTFITIYVQLHIYPPSMGLLFTLTRSRALKGVKFLDFSFCALLGSYKMLQFGAFLLASILSLEVR